MVELERGEIPPTERMYCNRTLNLRGLRAVGFDMDYTLIHYKVEVWESHAYHLAKERLIARGWPMADCKFDPEFATLGLIFDIDRGNIVKANRFGYVKRAAHGTHMLEYPEQRESYARVVVDLSEPRWRFLNTLFGMSEACLFAQGVDLLDAGKLEQPMSYRDVYNAVRASIDETHMMGQLKEDIIANPDRFVELDPAVPLALQDLRAAGKKVLLITNSGWAYTSAMMTYAFDRFVPDGTWRDLFDLVVVAAKKPDFFASRKPIYEIVDTEQGLMRPEMGDLREGGVYHGGTAAVIEKHLDVRGEDILYVGDHLFADVKISKKMHRWRTALVVRELEEDLAALDGFKQDQEKLSAFMDQKTVLEHLFSCARLDLQRLDKGYGPAPTEDAETLKKRMQSLRAELVALDAKIAPLAKAGSQLANTRWGLLMRAGNDKSMLAKHVERNADAYTSRVSNFCVQTPFVYLRSPRGSLPHDFGPEGGA